ncbi:hypothetical protein Tel_06365 [Candidatus Tenderia electrophaga]|jgi:uncharacterized protein|uniref:Xcc1710-like domain-containing protein n=1 Tax=Candidatus Tenderia electrophaga TaxID=1748243 RepID=A0A0S2TCD6_9GAMM|nr:hypothetical protein Tel_06365 [Candidatus Tenderia electrophaga]
MQIHQDLDIHHYSIKGYDRGEVVVLVPLLAELNEETDAAGNPAKGLQQESLTSSAIITAKQLIRDWPPQCVEELTQAHVAALAQLNPEVAIIGTGARLQWPKRALLRPLVEAGIGFEIMDTAAACRTYNVLSYEERRVAAALMMI